MPARPLPVPEPTPLPVPVPPSFPPEGTVPAGTAGGLWYRLAGRGSDTVVVPLGAYLQTALAPLAESHTVIFYDPRRRGRSDAAIDSTLETFADDVRDLEAVRAHFGLSRMSVVAFSYFAGVAVTWAAEHPDRVARLVLVSPIEPTDSLERRFNPPERLARIDTTAARALVRMRAAGKDTTDPTGYCRAYWRVNAAVFVGDPSRASRVNADWCEFPTESPAALGAHLARVFLSLGDGWNFGPAASKLMVPTLVVHGARDLVVNPDGARAWGRLISGSRVWPLPDHGHLHFLEDARRVADGIDRFLRGDWPDGAVRVPPSP